MINVGEDDHVASVAIMKPSEEDEEEIETEVVETE